jgi:hypothetical protein
MLKKGLKFKEGDSNKERRVWFQSLQAGEFVSQQQRAAMIIEKCVRSPQTLVDNLRARREGVWAGILCSYEYSTATYGDETPTGM